MGIGVQANIKMNRREALSEFYEILDRVRVRHGGFKRLAECHGRMGWPTRGVYFFFEPGEFREDGRSERVVRVGTHAVSLNSRATLWTRLRQHRGRVRGRNPGGGNHRESQFRYLVGDALLGSGYLSQEASPQSWGVGNSAPA